MTTMPRTITAPSPNYGKRPAGVTPSGIILHADAGATEAGTVSWLVSPKSGVSYHAFIGRDGTLFEIVPDDRRAWHAGVSTAAALDDCNDWTLGLCFANRQDGKEAFTPAQIAAGVRWVVAKRRLYPKITLDRIWTHEQCARPEGRKSDPGVLFPLSAFLTAVRVGMRG